VKVALKRKTFRALHQPQKVLVVELLICPTRCAGYSIEHRVDDCTGPERQVTYSPFLARFYSW